MRTIAVVAQKGGSTKTTTVLNMAAALAGEGLHVLAVDADTQGNLSHTLLGGVAPQGVTLSEVLLGDAAADDAIVPTRIEGVELIPAVPGLADVAVRLAAEAGRERRLLTAMDEMTRRFDVCLIDTGPTRSLLITNVLTYVGEVLVPTTPCLYGFLGLQQLQADMAAVRRYLGNKHLTLLGVLLAMTEKTKLSKDFEAQMRAAYGELIFKTTIPRSVKFGEAGSRSQTIFEYARLSPGALAYEALTLEVMSRGRDQQEGRDGVAGGATGDLRAHGAA
jgi:chromosome partitioning protein